MRYRIAAVTAALAATVVAVPGSAQAAGTVLGVGHPAAIAGSYIVVLKQKRDLTAADSLLGRDAKVTYTYGRALSGFAVRTDLSGARRLARDPRVAYVVQDHQVDLGGRDAEAAPAPAVTAQGLGVQTDPPNWGLDRIDQRSRPLDKKYFHANTASSVRAYVLGTGIRYTHQEFDGAAVPGTDLVGGVTPPGDDCHGLGTHVAGVIGGRTTGVAKDVTLVSVRVANCQGSASYSQVIGGIDWLTEDALASGKKAVAVAVIGGPTNKAFNDAVTASIAAGVHYSVIAGASNTNACNSSPGGVADATTVGAVDINDVKTSFSNYGPCIDVWAPGANITSAWNTSDTAYSTISGSSAAAHAAGVAALWRHRFPGDSAVEVAAALKANATPGVVTGTNTGPADLLLHSGSIPV
ncbi:hypothetical protein GCM10022243_19880 [Saccharothrix violaceirubra]|uniref:Peptidase inhibitor I9 n=1 Tax=Saccharothrix violaceirubra TaxID=413306 RepID=A0A7W7T1Z5_9PSEU|nr:S8 family peptidase [Saccharothrix violaceirubra]MBB4965107.1 hypothetical protein [Saccharothrix violaceirubra]